MHNLEAKTCDVPRKQRPEVAEIFHRYFEQFLIRHRLSADQHRVARHVQQCRTAALGGHIEACDSCTHTRISYNSCRDRHCPKCQAMAKEQWLAARQAELLPCGYFHLVFTLPHQLNLLVLHNRKLCLGLIFSAVNWTLQSFAADPQWRLNGQLGFIGVLHTWSKTLIDHFHLHCLIPAGVLTRNDQRWIRTRKKYLFRRQSLADCFRNRYLAQLERLYDKGELLLPAEWDHEQFQAILAKAKKTTWIAYTKRPFAGPKAVLDYLAGYTHRVAIANHRLQSIEDGKVSFSYKDRKNKNARRTMTISAEEFIRRFLLHVLPNGFTKIRYFGFLSANKRNLLSVVKYLLGDTVVSETTPTTDQKYVCPHCGAKLLWVKALPKATRAPP